MKYHYHSEGLVLPRFSQIYYNMRDNLQIENELIDKLIRTSLFRYDFGNEFDTEHAWENQLPFILIGSRKHRVPILPILVGAASLERLKISGEMLINLINRKYELDRVLFVITSDFTHYGPIYNYIVPGNKEAVIKYLLTYFLIEISKDSQMMPTTHKVCS